MSHLPSYPHRRYNALTGEWVLVSPHRTQRPWQGKQESTAAGQPVQYDPSCYLCPGNTRANGEQNPQYEDQFVFTNDFAALLPDAPELSDGSDPLFRFENVRGTSRVICFSPRHDLTLPEMAVSDIRGVIDAWSEQTVELGEKYRWVQVFENKGEIMGCSNPHPHGQIWAGDFLPNEPQKEDRQQADFSRHEKTPLLIDYLDRELVERERIVIENEHWVWLVPFWAVWPFETMLIPRRHVLRLPDLVPSECDALADILKKATTRYDNLFETSFPYTMGWHGAPFGSVDVDHWQLHAHFYPPLLRSARVRKFMVGYEMLAEAQRDISPEIAAASLSQVSDEHYKFAR